MAKKEGYSIEGAFGTIKHYDSKGRKIGESIPSMWGGYNNYDAKGRKIGETRPSLLGYNSYDNKGNKTGSSMQGLWGTNHYDARGRKVGTTTPGILGSNTYGDGSSGADIMNRASADAALRNDAIAQEISVVAGQSRQKNANMGISEISCASASDITPTAEEMIRYVIVRLPGEMQNRFYWVSEKLSVGEQVMVSNYDSPLQVLAVVECAPSATPCPVEEMPCVLSVVK